MALDDMILHRLLEEQCRVFRVACDPLRYGLTLKAVSIDSGIPPSTLRTYAAGQAIMPVTALYRLCGVIPDEVLSLLLPGEHMIVLHRDDGDHDTLASNCIDFAGRVAGARHPASPGGVEITDAEDRDLTASSARLRAG